MEPKDSPWQLGYGLLGISDEMSALRARVRELEADNDRLRLALALLKWKPAPNRGGRPRVHTAESDEQLLVMVEEGRRRWRMRTDRALLRKIQAQRALQDPTTYRSQTKLAQELTTMEKQLSRARGARKARETSEN